MLLYAVIVALPLNLTLPDKYTTAAPENRKIPPLLIVRSLM